jgi:hypothetical protein
MAYKEVKPEDVDNPRKHIALNEQPDKEDWVGIVLKKGDSFEGIYEGFRDWDKGADNKGRLYNFHDEDDDEDKYFIYDCAILHSRMGKVPYEGKVKIEYLGKQQSKNNPKNQFHNFNVYVDTD